MSLKKDIIGAEVQIGTNEAQANLTKLAQETATLTNENDRLRISQAKLKALGKGYEDQLKKVNNQIADNNKSIKDNKAQMDALRKTIGLTEMTLPQLRKRASELKKELSLMGDSADPIQFNKLNNELIATQHQIDNMQGKIGITQKSMSKFSSVAGGLLPALAPAAIVAALGRIGTSMFNLTKQIQGETIRSVTVFGDQMGYVEKQAEKVAAKMGVTNREFVSMAANTADLLIPLDFTRETAAKMSTDVQSLAGALDEWTAGKYGVAEVSEILTKAMLGEMEQLKGLGIAIRQDSKEYTDLVKQKEAIAGTTNAQARAMATLELLYKKSADAQNAYTLEGNKLLRFQKSVSLWFKEFKEEIATGFSDSMKTATQQYTEQQEKVSMLDKTLIPLLNRYDELSTKKMPLTNAEQAELNGLIQQIATITPGAITEMDKYGKVLGISSEQARILVDEQKKYLAVKNADEIAAQEKAVEKLNKQLEHQVAVKKIAVLSAQDERVAGTKIGDMYADQANAAQSEIDKLNSLIEGRQHWLKVLKGEPIVTSTNPDEVTVATSLIEAQETLLKQAQELPETTETEIAFKNRKIEAINEEIKRLKELGLTKKETEAALKIKTEEDAPIDTGWIFGQVDREAEAFAKKKRTEEEWTKFLEGEVEKRIQAQKKESDIEKEIELAREDLKEMRVEAIGQIAGALSGMFESGSAAQIAALAIEKAIAIAQIWMSYAKESAAIAVTAAELNAVSLGTAGTVWGTAQQAKALTRAGINTGIVAAQAIAQSVGSKKAKGKKAGGYTTTATSDDMVVDYVHSNEFVGNAKSVRNPTVKPVYDIIDMAQKNGTIETLNLPAVLGAIGRRAGGYGDPTTTNTTASPSGDPNLTQLYTSSPGIPAADISRLSDAIEALLEWEPKVGVGMVDKPLQKLKDIRAKSKLMQ